MGTELQRHDSVVVLTSGAQGRSLTPVELALDEAGRRLDEKARAENTRRAYARDWATFEAWCSMLGAEPLPASVETVCRYLTDLSLRVDEGGRPLVSPPSMKRYLSSISYEHKRHGLESPTRRDAVLTRLAGIVRDRQHEPRQMRAFLMEDVQTILGAIDRTTLAGARDAFVILLGFSGACRRSDIAQLEHRDVELRKTGLWVTVRHSKTDQEGRGMTKSIPYGRRVSTCTPCAWVRWLAALAGDDPGPGHVCRGPVPAVDPRDPLLRTLRNGVLGGPMSGGAVHDMVKRRAAAVDLVEKIGSHSMRAGFVTTSLAEGASAEDVMEQTGHRSHSTMMIYRRSRGVVVNGAASRLGL